MWVCKAQFLNKCGNRKIVFKQRRESEKVMEEQLVVLMDPWHDKYDRSVVNLIINY